MMSEPYLWVYVKGVVHGNEDGHRCGKCGKKLIKGSVVYIQLVFDKGNVGPDLVNSPPGSTVCRACGEARTRGKLETPRKRKGVKDGTKR